MNPLLIKNYDAGAVVNSYRLVKAGAADGAVIQATDGSAAITGVSGQVAVTQADLDAGRDRIDIVKAGISLVELGDTVVRGTWITADANGKGIPAVIVAGTALHVAGVAEVSGVAGDIIEVDMKPTVIGNDTEIVEATVTVSSAELLALNAAPKTLIAAPGAGKAIVLEGAQRLMLDYNSAAYDGIAAGEDLAFKYTDANGATLATVEATGFLDQAADEYRHVYPAAAAAVEPVANAPVVLHMLTGEIATGNSPLKVRVRYRTVTLAL